MVFFPVVSVSEVWVLLILFSLHASPTHFFICSLEMEAVGNRNASVEILYTCLQARKHKDWLPVHEDVANKLLDLCVELKNAPLAKETLIQYRNISQAKVMIVSLHTLYTSLSF